MTIHTNTTKIYLVLEDKPNTKTLNIQGDIDLLKQFLSLLLETKEKTCIDLSPGQALSQRTEHEN